MAALITRIGNLEVAPRLIPRPRSKPFIPLALDRRICVLHTTEGTTLAGAYATLAQSHSAPHFIVGEGRIYQCRPLAVQAAALRDPANRDASVQIECVGQSQQTPYQLPAATAAPLVALLAWLNRNAGLPLVVPAPHWADDLSDMKGEILATATNSRRRAGLWPQTPGVWMHLEVPGNHHWDCGALNRRELLAQAQLLAEG